MKNVIQLKREVENKNATAQNQNLVCFNFKAITYETVRLEE
jgi:hypothetical protein